MLVEFLDDHCMVENQKVKTEKSEEQIVSAFDFVYLPMDFRYAIFIQRLSPFLLSFVTDVMRISRPLRLLSLRLMINMYVTTAAQGVTKDTHSLTSPTPGQCGSFTSPRAARNGNFSILTRFVR